MELVRDHLNVYSMDLPVTFRDRVLPTPEVGWLLSEAKSMPLKVMGMLWRMTDVIWLETS
jgi:hypothetical protein